MDFFHFVFFLLLQELFFVYERSVFLDAHFLKLGAVQKNHQAEVTQTCVLKVVMPL